MTNVISSVTFETAALADVIKKAAKVAPSKGAAFDKAAGIVLEFAPGSPLPLAVVRATNLDIFMMEWVTVTEWTGEVARWRLPSSLLALVIGSLPIGTGKTVTMESQSHGVNWIVNLKSGRTKAKFFPIDIDYYPQWGAFDPDDMFPAHDLGGRISQVEWATSKNDPKLAGILLDGTYAIACDGYRLARVPLSIPNLDHPIIVPSDVLGQILKETGEVQIGKSSEDNLLRIMPNDYTQMKAILYDVDYPPVDRIFAYEFDQEVKVNRDALMEIMQRINSFSVGDRVGGFKVYFGKGEIALYMENEQVGSIGDVLEVPGQCDHERYEKFFTPKNLMDALSKSPNVSVTLKYSTTEPRYPVKVDDEAGYEAWVMPRTQMSGE